VPYASAMTNTDGTLNGGDLDDLQRRADAAEQIGEKAPLPYRDTACHRPTLPPTIKSMISRLSSSCGQHSPVTTSAVPSQLASLTGQQRRCWQSA
jgi:hypothetical protein